jgi:phosphate transport system ATP-binding protein
LLEAFDPMASVTSQPRRDPAARSERKVLKKRIAVPSPRLTADDTEPSAPPQIKASVEKLDFWYGPKQALKDLNLTIAERRVTALIGPSGCGKSTFLRCFNRMHDLQVGTRYEGRIVLQPDNLNLIGREIQPIEARMRIGMVFQRPNPFPRSIFENVAYGLRLRGVRRHSEIEAAVERALRSAALWEETKDRLHESALVLSGGQMQRLCIARGLVTKPEMLLFDEPTSALDPTATAKIEELISSLRDEVTVLIVTHNMQQAARVSDYTAFMYLGELIEFGDTSQIFTNPSQKATEDYITGRYG